MHEPMPPVDRIRAFIFRQFPRAREAAVGNDASLLEGGILHSLGVLEIVDFLETEFGIVFADEEVVADVFDTIDGMAAFVEAKRDPGADR